MFTNFNFYPPITMKNICPLPLPQLFTPYAMCQLHVFWHDCNTLGMYSA